MANTFLTFGCVSRAGDAGNDMSMILSAPEDEEEAPAMAAQTR